MSKGDRFGYHYQLTSEGGKTFHWTCLQFNLWQVQQDITRLAERNQGEEFTITITAVPVKPHNSPA